MTTDKKDEKSKKKLKVSLTVGALLIAKSLLPAPLWAKGKGIKVKMKAYEFAEDISALKLPDVDNLDSDPDAEEFCEVIEMEVEKDKYDAAAACFKHYADEDAFRWTRHIMNIVQEFELE